MANPSNYVPDPIPEHGKNYTMTVVGGGGGAGSVAQQVFQDEPVPTDPTKPAVSFPTGGGSLTQWDVASQSWV